MAQIKLGPNGLPINEGFFGNQGLGSALASLPGTPILDGGRMPVGPGGEGLTPGQPPPGTAPPEAPGGGINGYRSDTGYGSPLAGGTPQTNPGTPPPNAPAGVTPPGGSGNFWGDQNPWAQNVGASINDQPVSFASPGNPNTNYLTPEAAGKVGQTFGANVVSQNLNNMSSPGSSAPSAPIYGLDFGKGDIQDAGMGAFQLARGDRPEDIAARYAAGINNTGWGGPAPTVSRADENGMWNYSTPTSTYDPSQSNAQQAQLIQWLKGQIGQA